MINIKKNKDHISLKIAANGVVGWYDAPIAGNETLNAWIWSKSMPLFDSMPTVIKGNLDPELRETFGGFVDCVYYTNEAVKKYKDTNVSGNGVLFYNVGNDIRYKSLCNGKDWKYLNLDLGFDRKKRVWGKSELPMTVDGFIDYLISNGINRIVTINSYLVEKYLSHTAIDLGTLFKKIGVELITINVDPYDMTPSGFIKRETIGKQFSNLNILNEHFDNGNDVIYGAMPQDFSRKPEKKMDDYNVIVLSNSRLKNIEPMRQQIDRIIEILDGDNLYRDVNVWYLALRWMILNVFNIPKFKKFHVNSILHHFYFAIVNKLKHRIIKEIKTDRTVRVYGDDGWKSICPEYYKGCLDNDEMERLFSEDNHLYLLLNASFSYLDASGPVYDMIGRNLPFINVPPMVSLFDGMKPI